jgi:hypothetical protein
MAPHLGMGCHKRQYRRIEPRTICITLVNGGAASSKQLIRELELIPGSDLLLVQAGWLMSGHVRPAQLIPMECCESCRDVSDRPPGRLHLDARRCVHIRTLRKARRLMQAIMLRR